MADPNTEGSIQNNGIPKITLGMRASTVLYSPTDKTLSISEMPADAKATGNAITNVRSDVSDVQADVTDLYGSIDDVNDEMMSVKSVQETQAEQMVQMQSAVNDAVQRVDTLTGVDIPVDPSLDAPSVADKFQQIENNIFIQMFPIGSIYMTSNAIAPSFPGVYWEEVVPTATYGELKADAFHFIPGTGTGSSHYWRSTTAPEPEPEDGGETP